MEELIKLCKNSNLDKLKDIYSKNSKIYLPTKLITEACKNSNKDIFKWLFHLKAWVIPIEDIDDIYSHENILCYCCRKNYFDLVKWIYSTNKIDIYAKQNESLYLACENGNIEIAKWIYNLGCVGINSESFRCNHYNILEWLVSLDKVTDKFITARFEELCLTENLPNIIKIYDLIKSSNKRLLYSQSFCRDEDIFKNVEISKWICATFNINIVEKNFYNDIIIEAATNNNDKIVKWVIDIITDKVVTYKLVNSYLNILGIAIEKGYIKIIKLIYDLVITYIEKQSDHDIIDFIKQIDLFAGSEQWIPTQLAYYTPTATASEDDDSDMSDWQAESESTVRSRIATERATGIKGGSPCPPSDHCSLMLSGYRFRWIQYTLVNKLPRLHLREQSNSILKLNYSILITAVHFNQLEVAKWINNKPIQFNEVHIRNLLSTWMLDDDSKQNSSTKQGYSRLRCTNETKDRTWPFYIATAWAPAMTVVTSKSVLNTIKWLYSLKYIDITSNIVEWNIIECNDISVIEWYYNLEENINLSIKDKFASSWVDVYKYCVDINLIKYIYSYCWDILYDTSLSLTDTERDSMAQRDAAEHHDGRPGNAAVACRLSWIRREFTKRLFNNTCKNGKLETAKWFYNGDGIKLKSGEIKQFNNTMFDIPEAFNEACSHNQIEVAKWLWSLNLSVDEKLITARAKLNNEPSETITKIVQNICDNGNMELLEWLDSLNIPNFKDSIKTYLNTINNMEEAFLRVRRRGYIEAIEWIINKDIPDIMGYNIKDRSEFNKLPIVNIFTMYCKINLNFAKLIYPHIPPNMLFMEEILMNVMLSGYWQHDHLYESAAWLHSVANIKYTDDMLVKILIYICSGIRFNDTITVEKTLKFIYSVKKDIIISEKDYMSCIREACINDFPQIAKILYDNYNGSKDRLLQENTFQHDSDSDFTNPEHILGNLTRECLSIGNLEIAKWLISLKNNINIDDEFTELVINIRSTAVILGNIERLNIVQWLYEKSKRKYISDEVFEKMCYDGHLDIVKWMYSLNKANINLELLWNILCNCSNGQLEIIKWIIDISEIKPFIDYDQMFQNACKIDQIIVEGLAHYGRGRSVLTWLYNFNPDKTLYNYNQAFIEACDVAAGDNIEWLYNLNIEYSIDVLSKGFYKISENASWRYAYPNSQISRAIGKLEEKCIIDWFINKGVDIHIYNDFAFRNACEFNDMVAAKKIYNMGGVNIRASTTDEETDVGPNNEKIAKDYAFRAACYCGNLKIVKWLLTLCNEYDYELFNENDATSSSDSDGDSDSDSEDIEPKYLCIIKDEPLPIEYYIKHKDIDKLVDLLQLKKTDNLDLVNCSICYDKSEIITECGHSYCMDCLILNWYNKPCPYCNSTIDYSKCSITPLNI